MNQGDFYKHLDELKELALARERRYRNVRMFEIMFDEIYIRLKRN